MGYFCNCGQEFEHHVERTAHMASCLKMTDQKTKLEEIKARLEKATPGPWTNQHRHFNYWAVFTAVEDRDFGPLGICKMNPNFDDNAKVNSALIANAPTDLQYLLTLVERQAAEIERLKEFEWMYKDLCK